MANQLNDRTTVNLSISSWWHVLAIILVIVSCYFGLKADTDRAVSLSNATASQQKTTDEKVNAMQMDIRSVADDVKWFRQTYEKDMNHYIRDSKTR